MSRMCSLWNGADRIRFRRRSEKAGTRSPLLERSQTLGSYNLPDPVSLSLDFAASPFTISRKLHAKPDHNPFDRLGLDIYGHAIVPFAVT